VGIATGLVVVGDLIGSSAAQEQAVVGETPNLSARLQGLAEPNAVFIAESTRRLLGSRFELDDLGPKDLKGVAQPIRAFAVLRPGSIESRFEALRTATTPLVGREEELDLLLRRWEQAKRGDGCVVLISASPVSASHASRRLSWNVSATSHTYATSARRIIRTAHSIRALPSSNERQVSGARIRPSSGSPSWMQSWPNARELLRQQGKRLFGVLVQDVIVRWPPWSPQREGPVQRDRWRKTTTETISV
jgi:Adenylate and Guanylate cyclase catalytic domain